MSTANNNLRDDNRPIAAIAAYLQSHRLVTAFGLLILLHAPTLLAYGRGLAGRDHYQFFPVVWIALLVLVFARGSSAIARRWYQAALLAVDLMMLVLASVYRSPWLGFAGFCAGCLALLWAGRDKVTGRSLWPLILLPALTLRPPLNLDSQIITRLQLTTTQAASLIIDRLGVLHHRRGVILELPDRELFIDEACSGIHSLFTLLGLAALIVLIHRRHWLISTLLLASAVVWALLLNVARVVIIVLAKLWWNVDLATGWQHDVLGFVLVAVALVCLLSTDRLLLLIFSRIPLSDDEDDELDAGENPLVRLFNWFFRPPPDATRPLPDSAMVVPSGRKLPVAMLIAGLVIITGQVIGLSPRLRASAEDVGVPQITQQTLAEKYGDWKRGEYWTEERSLENMWGEQSSQWNFFRGARLAQVSLDYPFEGWHELVNCYRNTGWQITRREVRSAETPSRDWPLIVVVMQDELNEHGVVCWSQFDRDGEPVLPARDQLAAGVVDRWKRSTGRLGTYQVQTFSSSLTPPGDEDLEELVRLHCQTRDDLVRGATSTTASEAMRPASP